MSWPQWKYKRKFDYFDLLLSNFQGQQKLNDINFEKTHNTYISGTENQPFLLDK